MIDQVMWWTGVAVWFLAGVGGLAFGFVCAAEVVFKATGLAADVVWVMVQFAHEKQAIDDGDPRYVRLAHQAIDKRIATARKRMGKPPIKGIEVDP